MEYVKNILEHNKLFTIFVFFEKFRRDSYSLGYLDADNFMGREAPYYIVGSIHTALHSSDFYGLK